MKRNKLTIYNFFPIYVLLVICMFYSGYVFISDGIVSGYKEWLFYGSALGVLIPLSLISQIIRGLKTQKKEINNFGTNRIDK